MVPADPLMLRVARLTAAGLGTRIGFSYDEVEDVKIAVDELCFSLLGSKGRPGSLELTYRLNGDTLTVEGVGRFEGGRAGAPSDLSARILEAVVDEHELVAGDGEPARFRLVKRRSANRDG